MGITKATAKAKASGHEKVYDGTAFECELSSKHAGDFEGVAAEDTLLGKASTGTNVNAGTYTSANGTVVVSAWADPTTDTNINNYIIVYEATLKIKPKDISNDESVGPIEVIYDSYPEYNGTDQRPDGQAGFSVHYKPAGKPEIIMGNNADYIVTGETGKDATAVDAYTLTITGTGTNYTGTKTVT